MSQDLKVTYLLAPIEVVSSTIDEPGRCVIVGRSGFYSAVEVQVNHAPVGFSAVSDSRIIADVDPNLGDADLMKVTVWKESQVSEVAQLTHFEVGSRPQTVSGLSKLVQQFVMMLFKDPGTDAFFPAEGGGLMGLSKTFLAVDDQVALGEVNSAIKKTVKTLRRKQLGRYVPPDERLASAELVNFYKTDTGELRVFIDITSVAGKYTVGVGA